MTFSTGGARLTNLVAGSGLIRRDGEGKEGAEPEGDEEFKATTKPISSSGAEGTEAQAVAAAAVVLALKTPERVYTHIPFTMGNTTPVAAPVALAIAAVVNEISAEPLAPSRAAPGECSRCEVCRGTHMSMYVAHARGSRCWNGGSRN